MNSCPTRWGSVRLAKTLSAHVVAGVTEGLELGHDVAVEVDDEDGAPPPAPLTHADPAIASAMEQTRTE